MFDAPRDKTSIPDQSGDTTNLLAGMHKMMNDPEGELDHSELRQDSRNDVSQCASRFRD